MSNILFRKSRLITSCNTEGTEIENATYNDRESISSKST